MTNIRTIVNEEGVGHISQSLRYTPNNSPLALKLHLQINTLPGAFLHESATDFKGSDLPHTVGEAACPRPRDTSLPHTVEEQSVWECERSSLSHTVREQSVPD